jgi:hypothetical protein
MSDVLQRDEYERQLVAHWLVTPHGCVMVDMTWAKMVEYATDLNETLGGFVRGVRAAALGREK